MAALKLTNECGGAEGGVTVLASEYGHARQVTPAVLGPHFFVYLFEIVPKLKADQARLKISELK